jgi:hypothetical protein
MFQSVFLSFCAVALALVVSPEPARAADSYGFVISLFHTATYSDPSNCPRGGNGTSLDIQRRVLMREGYSRSAAQKILLNGKDATGTPLGELLAKRGKHKEAVDPFNDPASAVDPQIEMVAGRYAFGFNLDNNPRTGFEDPVTHEKGIDNELFRVVGCFKQYDVTSPVYPFYEEVMWDTMVDTMPAWVLYISGGRFGQDGPVTVTIDRAMEHVRRNASGGALQNATFTLEPQSRSRATFSGEIKGNELLVTAGSLRLEGEAPILTQLALKNMHLRLTLGADGSLTGFIGGYQPWEDFFYMASSAGEGNIGLDIPGIYYALKAHADAYPDPATGQNTAISAAYAIKAVPAFLADTQGRLLATSISAPRFNAQDDYAHQPLTTQAR